jgi:hypothetical protein
MVDMFTKERRSEIMARITDRDTKPEKRVRSLLHRMGLRFRLHRKDLPGKPDLVLRKVEDRHLRPRLLLARARLQTGQQQAATEEQRGILESEDRRKHGETKCTPRHSLYSAGAASSCGTVKRLTFQQPTFRLLTVWPSASAWPWMLAAWWRTGHRGDGVRLP